MSEKTKRKARRARKTKEEKKVERENSASRAPTEKSYYYDDAHGYKIYNSEMEDRETNEN